MKVQRIARHSSHFPEALRHIPSPPKELFVRGNIEPLLQKVGLAVVGSRKVTPYGRAVTLDLIQEVASQGIVIISGLAFGVDTLAHQATLNAGGYTIAVLACGLDRPYPAANRQLAERILDTGGTLISEYPEGTPPLRQNFIARNRLVSGLSDGVIIMEATNQSGTLHTAKFALEQGKTVMAVPGNITSELSQGTNSLIKTGATPVTSTADILEALGGRPVLAAREVLAGNAEEAAILEPLKRGITDGADLQSISRLDPAVFNQTLTMLEITGKIRPSGAGHWALK